MALVKTPTLEEEFKKNPELKKSDLNILRDWLKKQPHLPPMSDSELALFLHSNYYRIEPTKTTIDIFFTTRTHIPEILSDRDPLGTKGIREIIKVLSCVQMQSTTPEGYKAIYGKLIDSNLSYFSLTDLIKVFGMFSELWLYTSGTCEGHILIIDLDGVLFGHLARMNPIVIKKGLYYLQEALPVRLKAIYIINTPPFIDVLFNLFKPFIKKEFFDLISFHSNVKSLEEKVPIDILPDEVGGKAGSLIDLWEAHIEELEDHRAWFLEQETRRADESARPGEAKSAMDLFGVEGSFKKLDID